VAVRPRRGLPPLFVSQLELENSYRVFQLFFVWRCPLISGRYHFSTHPLRYLGRLSSRSLSRHTRHVGGSLGGGGYRGLFVVLSTPVGDFIVSVKAHVVQMPWWT
jgi:hypothetical protein